MRPPRGIDIPPGGSEDSHLVACEAVEGILEAHDRLRRGGPESIDPSVKPESKFWVVTDGPPEKAPNQLDRAACELVVAKPEVERSKGTACNGNPRHRQC